MQIGYKVGNVRKRNRFQLNDDSTEIEEENQGISPNEIAQIEPFLQQIDQNPPNLPIILQFFERVTGFCEIGMKLVDSSLSSSVLSILSTFSSQQNNPNEHPEIFIPSMGILYNLIFFKYPKDKLITQSFDQIFYGIAHALVASPPNFVCINCFFSFTELFADSKIPPKILFEFFEPLIPFISLFLTNQTPKDTVSCALQASLTISQLNGQKSFQEFCKINIVPILFHYLRIDSEAYVSACKLLGYLSLNNIFAKEHFPDDYLEVFSVNLQVDNEIHQLETIEMLSKMSTIDTLAEEFISSKILKVLFELGETSSYGVREKSMEFICDLMQFNSQQFEKAIVEYGTFDFFIPFLETENIGVIINATGAISTIFNRLWSTGKKMEMDSLIEQSSETLNYIQSYTENNEGDIEEAANLIMGYYRVYLDEKNQGEEM